jgi:hypothetical protein
MTGSETINILWESMWTNGRADVWRREAQAVIRAWAGSRSIASRGAEVERSEVRVSGEYRKCDGSPRHVRIQPRSTRAIDYNGPELGAGFHRKVSLGGFLQSKLRCDHMNSAPACEPLGHSGLRLSLQRRRR